MKYTSLTSIEQWQEEYERLQQALKVHEASKPVDEEEVALLSAEAIRICVSLYEKSLINGGRIDVGLGTKAKFIGKQLKDLLS